MMTNLLSNLRRALKRKVIGSPTGFEPPNLSALIDRTLCALEKPKTCNSIWLDHLKQEIQEAKKIIVAVERSFPWLEVTLRKVDDE